MTKLALSTDDGTNGTDRTSSQQEDLTCSMVDENEEQKQTAKFNLVVELPLLSSPEQLTTAKVDRPCYRTYDDFVQVNGKQLKPGLYLHSNSESNESELDIWICSPIHVLAQTCDEHGIGWGLLLKFIDPNGQWHEWAMPKALLKGNGEELRGELLNLGVNISRKGNTRLLDWLANCSSEKRVIAATHTGWHLTNSSLSFVLPHKVLGIDNIRFQSEYSTYDDFQSAGTIQEWRENIAKLCQGNPMLILGVSAALAGPLLLNAKQHNGGLGIHLMGDSSQGKTTVLQVAGSVWGSPSFVRTWRSTSNGLEAVAAMLNDTLLILDEISECDSKEIGAIVYALGNGKGKQRANRSGAARTSARWRIMVLSSGERSLSAHMLEGGKHIKAGQEVRLLDIPATNRTYGAFDQLHKHTDGRAFSDALKQASQRFYGHAGVQFIVALLADAQDLSRLYADTLNSSLFHAKSSIEKRAASTFALIGMAGELAIDYEIVPWISGSAINAASLAYHAWKEFRGEGQTEDQRILQSIQDFINRYGDSRFSALIKGMEPAQVHDRAGYWKDVDDGRIYYFNSTALQIAGLGFDTKRILDALERSDWIFEHEQNARSKKLRIKGLKNSANFYAILPKEIV